MTFLFTLCKHLIYIYIHKYLHNTLLLEATLTVILPEPWRGTSCTHLRLGLGFFHPAGPQRSSQVWPNSDSDRVRKMGVSDLSGGLSILIYKLWLSGRGWFVLKATSFGCVLWVAAIRKGELGFWVFLYNPVHLFCSVLPDVRFSSGACFTSSSQTYFKSY